MEVCGEGASGADRNNAVFDALAHWLSDKTEYRYCSFHGCLDCVPLKKKREAYFFCVTGNVD